MNINDQYVNIDWK